MGLEILRWIGDDALLSVLIAEQPTLLLLAIIIGCIALLSKGADWMIDGVVDLAQRTGLPKIVIGATLVSLGTTLPEVFISIMAAYLGNPGLALGNGKIKNIGDRMTFIPNLKSGLIEPFPFTHFTGDKNIC